ncbi:uncharacterized protein LOC124650098 [Lolium rigidum]|uniref:uncharacterized protein LOC124650098 n=1 Tax=Lolium rigidum TaxID=89674 RepID=UPI001F5DEF8B|nr:uncharacterized protein LOC124650098 [Lolium rigidum]
MAMVSPRWRPTGVETASRPWRSPSVAAGLPMRGARWPAMTVLPSGRTGELGGLQEPLRLLAFRGSSHAEHGACIYFHTSCLDDYIAKCYHVEEFRKTYEHCLQPLEGMPAWPISNRTRPVAPGHIAMPGRKKKSRTKEPEEKPGSSRVSRAGTTIRCGKCKQQGHNRKSCERRNGGVDPTKQMPSQQSHTTTPSTQPPATQPRVVPSMPSKQSTTASTKSKASTQSGPSSSKRPYNKGSKKNHGLVQGSQASSSVTINFSSGNETSRNNGTQHQGILG